jgi:hypothetical protein
MSFHPSSFLELFFVYLEKNRARPSDATLTKTMKIIIKLLSAHWKTINAKLDSNTVKTAANKLSENNGKLYLMHHAAASIFNQEAYVGYHVGQVVFEASYYQIQRLPLICFISHLAPT